MCLQDLAISRHTYPKVTLAAFNATTRLKPNADRIGLLVSIQSVFNADVVVYVSALVDGFEAPIARFVASHTTGSTETGQTYLALNTTDYGGVIQGDLSVTMDGASSYIIERIATPELSKAIKAESERIMKLAK